MRVKPHVRSVRRAFRGQPHCPPNPHVARGLTRRRGYPRHVPYGPVGRVRGFLLDSAHVTGALLMRSEVGGTVAREFAELAVELATGWGRLREVRRRRRGGIVKRGGCAESPKVLWYGGDKGQGMGTGRWGRITKEKRKGERGM